MMTAICNRQAPINEIPKVQTLTEQPHRPIHNPRTIRVKRKGDQLAMQWLNIPDSDWFRGTDISQSKQA
jgi:hypothetical protein